MRRVLLVAAIALWGNLSQAQWVDQTSGTDARLRGLHALDAQTAWASGARGTVLRTTDGGRSWHDVSVPGAASLDFRDVHALDADTALVLSIGAGALLRIYRTTDAGRTWAALYTNEDPDVFLDAFAFWDARHGIALGDPAAGRFVVLTTVDGGITWTRIPAAGLPPALPGEGAFAASGTCLVVQGTEHAWFGTGGGHVGRVFRTTDRGRTWTVHETPVRAETASSGIFSLAFRDAHHGIAAGGDYKHTQQAEGNLARTDDGGRTWTPATLDVRLGYRSAVAYVPEASKPTLVAVGPSGSDVSFDDGQSWSRLGTTGFDTLSFAPRGEFGWAAGEGGRIARFAAPASAGQAEPAAPRRKRSPVERMATAHLKATHDDARRYQRLRRTLPALSGLNDYRAILHAHAEDSAHTGGTRAEMLTDAKRAGVSAILLTDHYRPPRDFVSDTRRGLREGVLFLPGSESGGFLLYPTHSVMDRMDGPAPALLEAVRADGGLAFLSHIEERPDHAMTGLDGMEIYNRHADAKKDTAGLISLVVKLTSPASLQALEDDLRLYPDELFASQVEYPADYLAKWDAETKTRRLTGVAANDCHHNQVLIVKMVDSSTVKVGTNVDADDKMRSISATLRPGIRALTRDHEPGDVLARVDLDPYHRSFRNVSTHILAPELSEAAIRAALRAGHAYVSHDWICDPTGFQFEATGAADASPTKTRILMGDELKLASQPRLVARFPVTCRMRLIASGKVIVARAGDELEHEVTTPGVYRVEGWLELDGSERPWIYSNPIYVRF